MPGRLPIIDVAAAGIGRALRSLPGLMAIFWLPWLLGTIALLILEVVVQDNCSPRESEYEEIRRYCHEAGFKYVRNACNIGGNPNIVAGFLLSDRADYLSAMNANQGYAMVVEKLMGLEVPQRAEYLRVIAAELNRIISHMLSIGALAMDVGAASPFIHALKEREKVNDLMELVQKLDGKLPSDEQKQQIKDAFTAVVKSQGVSDQSLIDKTIADIQAVNAARNVTADDLATLAADRKAIDELLASQSSDSSAVAMPAPDLLMYHGPYGGLGGI